jgi:hypothetical protein
LETLNPIHMLLLQRTKVIAANTDGTTWLSTFYDLLNSDAMSVYRRGTPYIQFAFSVLPSSVSIRNLFSGKALRPLILTIGHSVCKILCKLTHTPFGHSCVSILLGSHRNKSRNSEGEVFVIIAERVMDDL